MGSTRVYIQPFNFDGTYADDFIEVTKYVSGIDTMTTDADSLDYQLGVYLNSNVPLTLSNRTGKFTDVDNAESIFRYKRANSIVRVTWMEGEELPMAGFVQVPFRVSPEVTIFEGLLDDSGLTEDADSETVQFQVLGFESLFDEEIVPLSLVNIGDNASDLVYACLNQTNITNILTVDPANINLGTDLTVDAVAQLENVSVKDALTELLKTGNSVLYVVDRVVYVTDRMASVDLKKTYYGQASDAGVEDIINVTNINNGKSRCFNYFYWDSSTEVEKDNASIKKNRTQQQAISSDLFTDSLKREQILFNLLGEFKDPQKQFDIIVPMTYDSLDLNILDRINVDYPTVFVPTPGFSFPICGLAILGSSDPGPRGAVLPVGLWSLTLDPNDEFKILMKQYDTTNEMITFRVRKIEA